MTRLILLFAAAIAVVAIGIAYSGPVYAGQASDSPFTLLSTSTPTTTPYVFLAKGGKHGGGGRHGSFKGFHGNWKGHHGGWWRHGRYIYTPAYCSNWVWDGFEYKCYDEFDDDW